jgi:hypothetical protein
MPIIEKQYKKGMYEKKNTAITDMYVMIVFKELEYIDTFAIFADSLTFLLMFKSGHSISCQLYNHANSQTL